MMDYAALFLAGFGIGGLTQAYMGRRWTKRHTLPTQEFVIDLQRKLFDARMDLSALRANAFITNAKGHRVRYVNATPAERARAEGCD